MGAGKSSASWLLAKVVLAVLVTAAGCGGSSPASQDSQGDTSGGADVAADGAEDSGRAAAVDVYRGVVALPDLGSSDGAELVADAKAMRIELWRQGEPKARATMDVARWQLGVVAAWDSGRNYDPGVLATEPIDGLRWAKVAAMEPIAQPPGPAYTGYGAHFRLDLRYDDDSAAPRYILSVGGASALGAIALRPEDDALLAAWDADEDVDGVGRAVYLRLHADAPAGEGYYGLGEMMDSPQHRGQIRTTQLVGDFQLDGSSNEGHVRLPLLVGTRGWGLFLRTFHPVVFDVAASDAAAIVPTVYAHTLRVELLAADRAEDVVGAYWRSTGAPLLPAPWALGGLLWRNENKDQAEVLEDAAALRGHDLALSGMWVDRPYDTAVNDFGFDPKMFPDSAAMIAALHAKGLRLGLWSTPYLDPGYDGKPKAKHHDEAKAKDFYVKGPGAWSQILKWGPPIDFTNPAARAFFAPLVQQYTSKGIEGFKLDYGEDIVLGLFNVRVPWQFADGSDERTMHRLFQHGYHEAYAAHLPKREGLLGGGFLLARASAWGDQVRTSMIWPGDLCAGWMKFAACTSDGKCHAGGLPASVSAAISLPTAGFPLFGADTGGYRHGRASKELFLRWLQHTAFTGVLQIGGGSDHHPWLSPPVKNPHAPGSAFDAETLAHARTLIRWHARLFPVLWTAMVRAGVHFRGLGPVRALGLVHPELAGDPRLLARDADQHYLGDHLLVAPVLTPPDGAKPDQREVLFPPGKWVDLWDGSVHDGGAAAASPPGKVLSLQAALTKPLVFVRAGAVLPLLRPDVDTLAPSAEPGVVSFANDHGMLWARVELAGAAARAPSDPAGQTALWDGTLLRAEDDGGALVLRHGQGAALEGTRVFAAGVVWEIGGAKAEPKTVLLDGAPVAKAAAEGGAEAAVAGCAGPCWRWDAEAKRAWIRGPAAGGVLRVE